MRKGLAIVVVAILLVVLVTTQLGSSGSGLRRATRDRLDDYRGPQIHFVYAVPSGSADRRRDTDGTLSESIVLVAAWFHQQIGAPRLAVDTFKGRPDVTFVQLPRTNAAYKRLGADAVAADVGRALPLRRDKRYAIYYQGTLPANLAEVCGIGRGPPGAFAIAFIGQACFSGYDFMSAGIGGYNRLVFVIAHEIVHELGFVPNCAPHSTGHGHVRDSSADLMYPILGDGVPILDVGNNDYYRAHIPGCPDLSRSPYLHGPASIVKMKR